LKKYCIFLKKELFESFKTFRLLVMGAVFFIFGMLSPLTAKFTPQILRWAFEMDDTIDSSLAGAFSSMPEPTALNSWAEFFSNIQMGLIVLVIVFSGMLASEMSRGTASAGGTLTIILTKGISRAQILLSKATSAALIWTGSLTLMFLTCLGYTAYFFPETWRDYAVNLPLAVFSLWVFGLFLIALTVMFAALTKRGYVCMVSVGGVVIALNIINIIPKIAKYNPVILSTMGYGIIEDTDKVSTAQMSNVSPSLAVAGICIIVMVWLGITAFNRKKI